VDGDLTKPPIIRENYFNEMPTSGAVAFQDARVNDDSASLMI